MESELKTLTPAPPNPQPERDDRPLLPAKPSQTQIMVPNNQSIEDMEKIYAAYVRHDVYGTMGRGDLPWTEKFLLGIGLVFVLPLRVVLAMVILVVYYLICRVCTVFRAPNREDEQEDYAHLGGWRRGVIVGTGRFLSRALLFVFGFYWIRKNRGGDESEGDHDGQCNDEVPLYSLLIRMIIW